jgi:hypothetical protein
MRRATRGWIANVVMNASEVRVVEGAGGRVATVALDGEQLEQSHGFRAVEFTDGSANEEREPDVLYEWRSGPL